MAIELSGFSSETQSGSEVNLDNEKKAHEFRSMKRASSPFQRAFLRVIRANDALWEQIAPTQEGQRQLEKNVALPGETHRISSDLFAKVYRNPQAAALYDVALYDSTQDERRFFRKKIDKGINYAPLSIVGGGGVYGTIVSATLLKENPSNPPLGFDSGKRRGGIWGISGDVTLDKAWWRMNSRNRPENRDKLPTPGTDGNLNSLGAEVQNLQVPDISSAQYPTNNEMGRVLSHDNFLSNNLVVNAELVKVRQNKDSRQQGVYQQEYQDKSTGERFFVYSDTIVQASGLGKEDLGFSDMFSSTREVLDEVQKDLEEGIVTPKVLTFFQLVEATTSNRRSIVNDFEQYAEVGKGDTSKVVREHFSGIGGIDPGVAAQQGFVKKVTVFGLEDKTREDLAKTERPRYFLGLLEFERTDGGYFRVSTIDGRVVGVGLPKNKEGIVVYYKRVDQTPEGPVTTIGTEIVPRLVTTAGFRDESDKIYSGLTATTVEKPSLISQQFDTVIAKPGSTIYYTPKALEETGIVRIDITNATKAGNTIEVTIIDKNGSTTVKRLSPDELKQLIPTTNIEKLEIAGPAPKFEPFFDRDYDSEIAVAEKAEGFDIYKVGACTNLPLTKKERTQTKAYEKIPENTKSIFRFVRPTVSFAKKLAQRIKHVPGSLNLETYKQHLTVLPDSSEKTRLGFEFPVSLKANEQLISPNLLQEDLLTYLAESRLHCQFPNQFENLSFGVKRIENENPNSPFSFSVKFASPLPDTTEWQQIDAFFQDPLMQRVLVQITGKSTNSAEITIGIRNGRVDIQNVKARSIKVNDQKAFDEKYKGEERQ